MSDKKIVIDKIKNLNDICMNKKSGLYKQWIYEKDGYMKMCNCMQKISYSLQDLNSEIDILEDVKYKDIVFIISLVDWIKEAFDKIFSLINDKIKNGFVFSKEIELQKRKQFLRALRSFAVGHPLNTTEHKKFGFDGNFICIDIRNKKDTLGLFDASHYYDLNYNGLFNIKSKYVDFYLYCYSEIDRMKYFRFIGCEFKDIYDVARLYIDKLYELNKYLSTKKRKLEK